MKFALCFTNFGPYHLARLRALATRLSNSRRSLDRLRSRRRPSKSIPGARAAPTNRSSGSPSFPTAHSETILPGDCRSSHSRSTRS